MVKSKVEFITVPKNIKCFGKSPTKIYKIILKYVKEDLINQSNYFTMYRYVHTTLYIFLKITFCSQNIQGSTKVGL